MKKVTLYITVVLVFAVLLFVGWKLSTNQNINRDQNLYTDKSSEATGVIKIGAALALSGDSSTVEWGEASKNGAQLAVQDINAHGGIDGKKLELVIEDMQSSSKGSVSAVTKLLSVDKVKGVLVTWLDVYQGAAPLAATYNIPIITPDGGIEAINGEKVYPGVYSTWYRTDVKAEKIVAHMAKQGIKKLAGVYQNDSYYSDFSNRVKKYADTYGITVVETELINSGTVSMSTQLLKIQHAKPDAVIFGLYDEKNVYSLLKAHHESMPQVKLFGDELVQDYYKQERYAGLFEGATYFHASAPESGFAARYKEVYKKDPAFGAGTSYDAVMILAGWLANSAKHSSVSEYIDNSDFETVSFGKMKFDRIGGVDTANNQFDLFRIKGGVAEKVI
jgi:branched-chain amino acid transport system substrate-binding protein